MQKKFALHVCERVHIMNQDNVIAGFLINFEHVPTLDVCVFWFELNTTSNQLEAKSQSTSCTQYIPPKYTEQKNTYIKTQTSSHDLLARGASWEPFLIEEQSSSPRLQQSATTDQA